MLRSCCVPTAEQTFSKIGIIKNVLHSTMGQACNLLLMSIEREIMRAVHFDDVIEDCLNEGSQGVAASVYALQSSP